MIIKSESQYIKVLLQGEKLAEIIEIGLIKLPEATTRHKVSKQIKYLLNISKKSNPELSSQLIYLILNTMIKTLPQILHNRENCFQFLQLFKSLILTNSKEMLTKTGINFDKLGQEVLSSITGLVPFEKNRNSKDNILNGLLEIEYALLKKFPKMLRDYTFKKKLITEIGDNCLFKIQNAGDTESTPTPTNPLSNF